jgi:hypothetical protein
MVAPRPPGNFDLRRCAGVVGVGEPGLRRRARHVGEHGELLGSLFGDRCRLLDEEHLSFGGDHVRALLELAEVVGPGGVERCDRVALGGVQVAAREPLRRLVDVARGRVPRRVELCALGRFRQRVRADAP